MFSTMASTVAAESVIPRRLREILILRRWRALRASRTLVRSARLPSLKAEESAPCGPTSSGFLSAKSRRAYSIARSLGRTQISPRTNIRSSAIFNVRRAKRFRSWGADEIREEDNVKKRFLFFLATIALAVNVQSIAQG